MRGGDVKAEGGAIFPRGRWVRSAREPAGRVGSRDVPLDRVPDRSLGAAGDRQIVYPGLSRGDRIGTRQGAVKRSEARGGDDREDQRPQDREAGNERSRDHVTASAGSGTIPPQPPRRRRRPRRGFAGWAAPWG